MICRWSARFASAWLSCARAGWWRRGRCERVFAAPPAAYTRMLIDAIPLPAVDPGWLMRGAAVEAAATA